MPDSDSYVSALCIYHESRHCGDGLHHLAPKAAIHIVVTPSKWNTTINVSADAASREVPQADPT